MQKPQVDFTRVFPIFRTSMPHIWRHILLVILIYVQLDLDWISLVCGYALPIVMGGMFESMPKMLFQYKGFFNEQDLTFNL